MHAAIEALSHGGSRPQPHSAAIVQGRLTHADIVSAAVLLIVTLAVRGVWFGNPVADFDEQLYSLIGWQITQGQLPFVDQWDRKPFGLFLIFAVIHTAFGPGELAYQLVASCTALAGAWLVYLLARNLVDRVSASVAGVLYLALLSAYGSYSAQSEVFHTPMMLLAVWLLCKPHHQAATIRALAAMLVCGMALQVKYTVVPQCIFLGGVALHSARLRGVRMPGIAGLATAFTILGLAPTLLIAAVYTAHSQFEAFWFANFVSFFERASTEHGRFWPGHVHGAIPIVGVTLLGLYAAWRLNPPCDRWCYGLFCGWALAAFGTVVMPSTVYLYYYGALAPAASLVALPLIDRTGRVGWLPAVALLGGMILILNPLKVWRDSHEQSAMADRLTVAITPYVKPSQGCLWIHDGPTALYRTSGSCLPTRFIYPDHLNNDLERNALGASQLAEVKRILAGNPPVIVTADMPITPQNLEVLALVRSTTSKDYHKLATEDLNGRGITAWVRNDLGS